MEREIQQPQTLLSESEQQVKQKLLRPSKGTWEDRLGKIVSRLCIGLIILIVGALLFFITSRGVATFTVNHVNLGDFLTQSDWTTSKVTADGRPRVGALPMIVTSFSVTILAALIATPFAIGTAIYMTELAPQTGKKILQPIIELLVGIPSVVYGFVGLTVLVPFIRSLVGGTGFGILSGALLLFLMIYPTITSLTVDSLKAVPNDYRQASLALGATRWQTIYKIILRVAAPGIFTAIIFGMARAFGEALAVQMVIGNAAIMPKGLFSPTATLTSQLTTELGNTVMGTLPNNALWSLALILLLMSLVFNLAVRLIAKKGGLNR